MTIRTGLVVLSLALSVAIGWTLSQGGRQVDRADVSDTVRIGLSLGTLKEERWQRDRDHFVERAEELGAEVLVQSGNSDGMRQVQDIEALISRGVDCLVVVAFNPAAMQKAVQTANNAGVPIVCYDRMITDCDVDLYISFDNVRVGRLQAQTIVDKLGGSGRIVRIHGPKTDHTAQLFKQGQDSVLLPLIEAGKIEVVHEDYADGWKPENAKKIVNAAITTVGTDFQAVIATNDGTAGGAIQALLEEGLEGKVLVSGQDADLAACRRIMTGTQAMTIYKPIASLAQAAAEAAYRLATGKVLVVRDEVFNGFKQVPALLQDVIVVDRNNIAETVIADGFHNYGKGLGFTQSVIFGGVGQDAQNKALQRGMDILVATPGRLLDLIGQGFVKLGSVEILILDEADQMLDMGFIHDLRKIVAHVPDKRQTLMFSATMPSEVSSSASVPRIAVR